MDKINMHNISNIQTSLCSLRTVDYHMSVFVVVNFYSSVLHVSFFVLSTLYVNLKKVLFGQL